jgi:hypothetical protein
MIHDIDTKTEALRIAGGAGLLASWQVTASFIVALLTIAYFVLQIIILWPKARAVWRGTK